MKSAKPRKERACRLGKREQCPLCGCSDLLSEGPDQFCLSCHWDTCAEYVERGLMNNLPLAYAEHFVWNRPAKRIAADLDLGSVFVEEATVGGDKELNIERVGQ